MEDRVVRINIKIADDIDTTTHYAYEPDDRRIVLETQDAKRGLEYKRMRTVINNDYYNALEEIRKEVHRLVDATFDSFRSLAIKDRIETTPKRSKKAQRREVENGG